MLVIVSEMGRGRRRSSAGERERRLRRSAKSFIKRLFEGLKLNWQAHEEVFVVELGPPREGTAVFRKGECCAK